MPENTDFNDENLIKFIENEALKDIDSIDVSSEDENLIDIKRVHTWYLETEKLIRILANIIPSTMAQPINQLRYAGHHILKATSGEAAAKVNDPNLIEAYKHCKRAYYDSLDLYVFHMSDVFRSKASLLAISDRELGNKITQHLECFTKLRFESPSRIGYYHGVSQTLLEGLTLVLDINKKLKEEGITDKLLSDKSLLITNLNELKQENNRLDFMVNNSLKAADKRFTYLSIVLTFIIVLVTAGSILFQGYFTAKFLTPASESLLTVKNLHELSCDLNLIKNVDTLAVSVTENKSLKKQTNP